jgi:hypothetical protein
MATWTPTPLEILQVRTHARVILYAAGELDLEAATEPLYSYAIKSGLAAELGPDVVQAIILSNFEFELESDS